MYLDANNFCEWRMSEKMSLNSFKWRKIINELNKKFINNYYEDSDKKYILEIDVEYPKNVCHLHQELPFLPQKNENVYVISITKKLCCSWTNIEKST